MPLLDIFWTMLWFFMWVAWIGLLIRTLADIFESDLSGVAKAGWTLFVVMLPLIGVFTYLIVHGDDMSSRDSQKISDMESAQASYIRNLAGSGSTPGDELTKLAHLKGEGVLSEDEFLRLKNRVLAQD